MYAKIEKPKKNKSRAVANLIGQKKSNCKQCERVVDNRPVFMMQRKLVNLIDNSHETSRLTDNVRPNSSIHRIPTQRFTASRQCVKSDIPHLYSIVTQRQPNKTSEDGGVGFSFYAVKYNDKPGKFSGGTKQGNEGLWPVGSVHLQGLGRKSSGGKWNTIADTGDVNNGVCEKYFKGHILAQSLGGKGGKKNIMAQDTSNCVGKWKSAETKINNWKKKMQNTVGSRLELTCQISGRNKKKLVYKDLDTFKESLVNETTKISKKMGKKYFM